MPGVQGIKGLYTKRGWYYFQPPTPKGGARPVAVALETKDLVTALTTLEEKKTEIKVWQASKAMTIEVLLPHYYKAKDDDVEATKRQRRVALEGFVEVTGNPRIKDVTTDMIDSWREHVVKHGARLPKVTLDADGKPVDAPVKERSGTTLRSYTIAVRAFFNWAVEEKYISVSPMKKMKRQVKVVRSKVQEFLTEEEREKVLATEAPPYVRLILHLGFFAGLRDGEMLALSPRWIWISDDGTRGTITVQDQPICHQDKSKGMWKPKVREMRTIPIHPRLLAFLKDHGIKSPWVLRPDKEFWPNPGMNSKRFDAHKALNSLAEKAGVPKLNYHILRHTFATLLVMKGVSLADVAGLLGDTLKVTEDHYAGYSPNRVSPVEVL